LSYLSRRLAFNAPYGSTERRCMCSRQGDKLKERFSGLLAALGNGEGEQFPSEGYTRKVTQTRVPRTLVALPHGNFAAIIPGDSVAETVITSGIASTLNLYQSALIVRVVLTW
jgi:hypothetical protein